MKRNIVIIGVVCCLAFAFTSASAQLGISFSADTLDLGDVKPCSTARDSFWLENTGTLIVPSPAVSNVTGFRIVAETFTNIVPGERRKMYVEFNGNVSRPFYRTPYILNVNAGGQSASDTVWLFARRLTGNCCVFVIDTIWGKAGETSSIVIRQDSTSPSVNINSIDVTMEIRYNPSVLVPKQYPANTLLREIGRFAFQSTLSNTNNVLFELPCTLTLGDAVESSIQPVNVVVSDINLIYDSYESACNITGVCQNPTSRLFNPFASRSRFNAVIHSGSVVVTMTGSSPESAVVSVYDLYGRTILRREEVFTPSTPQQFGILSPASLYFVQINSQPVVPLVASP